jgi:hypothetical protein
MKVWVVSSIVWSTLLGYDSIWSTKKKADARAKELEKERPYLNVTVTGEQVK